MRGKRNYSQILHSDKNYRWDENFYMVDQPLPWSSFCETNADARSVCGSYPCSGKLHEIGMRSGVDLS